MKSLYELIKDYSSISFIGMCKNAGKTTTLNQLIKELRDAGVVFGATSVGRDGESTDLVTDTVKPGIFVYKDTVLATAANLLKECDITKEILKTTGIYTPMGEIILLRALSDGFVQLAGPSITTQLVGMFEEFREFGAEKMLVDGALGRKSLCSRKVSESTILCTGASYHKSMDRVVADTAYTCELLQLPEADVYLPEEDLSKLGKYLPLQADRSVEIPEKPYKLEQLWNPRRKHLPTEIYVQGGMTDAMIRPALTSGADFRGKRLIFRDGSKILLSSDMYEKLTSRGLSFAVQDAIHLLGVTINPFSAYGFHFDKDVFKKRMQEAVTVPVYNVRDAYDVK